MDNPSFKRKYTTADGSNLLLDVVINNAMVAEIAIYKDGVLFAQTHVRTGKVPFDLGDTSQWRNKILTAITVVSDTNPNSGKMAVDFILQGGKPKVQNSLERETKDGDRLPFFGTYEIN